MRAVLRHIDARSIGVAGCHAPQPGTRVEIAVDIESCFGPWMEISASVERCQALDRVRNTWFVTCRLDRDLSPDEVERIRRRMPATR
jgi:hypothetical protein